MKNKLAVCVIALAALLSVCTDVFGQPPTQPASGNQDEKSAASKQFKIKLDGLVDAITSIKTAGTDVEAGIRRQFSANANIEVFALALTMRSNKELRKELEQYVRDIEDARVDKQVGGGDSNAGGTSLVTKGSVPAVLGFAVENGALMRDESGTTITFRANPVGIIKALGKNGFIQSYDDDTPFTRVLRRLSLALSFDASRGNEPGTFTGDRQQLSGYSFRFDVFNKRDPRHSSYRVRWADLIINKGQVITNDATKLVPLFRRDPALQSWLDTARQNIAAAPKDKVADVVKGELAKLLTIDLPPGIQKVIDEFDKGFDSFLAGRDEILKDVANGTIVTFDYTNIRQISGPDLSNFKLIVEGSPWNGKASLTANASLTIFNSLPTGMKLDRVRDYQFSGQLDAPLGEIKKIGSVVLTLSGKYEHMAQDMMTTGGMPMDTSGNIGIGQAKLTIPVKGTGVKIPLSFTYANRTELIKEKQVRGNFGVTFDLDSIFQRLHP